MPGFWQKMDIADQKVQVAEEIKRDIWKYLVSSDVANDMMLNIIMRVTFLPVQNKYPATRFIFQNFDKNGILMIKRYK